MDRPHIVPLFTETVSHTVFDLLWIPRSCRLVELGQEPRGTGALNVWKMEEDKLVLERSHSKASGFRCGSMGLTVLPHRRLTTGDLDGRVMVWDVETFERPLWVQKGHNVINCIDSGRGGLVLSGGRDGKANVWDVRMDKPAIVFEGEVDDNNAKVPECWAVSLLPGSSTTHVACGWESGDVKVWDIRKDNPIYQTRFSNGVCGVTLDDGNINNYEILHVSTLEGHVYSVDLSHPEFNIMEPTRLSHCNPCKASIWKVAPYPRNRTVLAVPSGDGSIRLIKYKLSKWDKEKLKSCMTSGSDNSNSVDTENKETGIPVVPLQKGILHQSYEMQLAMQAIPSVSWNAERPGLLAWCGFDQTINVGVAMNLDQM